MNALARFPLLRTFFLLAGVAMGLSGIVAVRLLEPADETLAVHAVYDELGHALTALIIAVGVRALRLPVPWWSVLIGGIAMDLGHVPSVMGYLESLDGSSRNGFHSLIVVAIIACLGFLDRRRANVWLGLAMGAVSHLWRDMGTGTVALLWPVDNTVYGTLYTRYLAVLAGIAVTMIGSAALLDVHAQQLTSSPAPGRQRDAPDGRAGSH